MMIVNIKKQRVWKKNIISAISHSKYKYFLLNQFFWGMFDRIQSKNHRIGTSENNKILYQIYDKIHILNNEYDGLALAY